MVIVLCGKSGSGKDTVAEELTKDEDYSRLVSTTSRPMRDGEVEGREYHFIDRNQFEKGIVAGHFVEHRAYHTNVGGVADTWYYGTPAFSKNENVLVAIKDLEGAKILKDYCEKIDEPFAAVLIEVPDNVREERARLRGSFDKTEWDRRVKADQIDFSDDKIGEVIDIRIANIGSITPKDIAETLKTFCNSCVKADKPLDEEIEM